MSKNHRLKGWHLIDDKNWEERLAEIKNERPGLTYKPTAQPSTLKPPIDECDPDCPICHGNAFYIDSQEHAIECPNARRRLNGGD